MSIIELTSENFASTVEQADTIFIDFWASWCGPCRRFAPIFEAAAEEHPDLTFAKLDTEAHPDIAHALGIVGIPTLMVAKKGVQVFNNAGALSKAQLESVITEVRAFDPDLAEPASTDAEA